LCFRRHVGKDGRYTVRIDVEGQEAVEESTDQFRSWEEASQAGKKALKKLSENSVVHTHAMIFNR